MRNLIFLSIGVIAICSLVYSCQNASEIELSSYLTNGKELYKAHCQNCHGELGEGLGELAPPLNDSLYLKLNKKQLACIIKNGSNKPLVINRKTYEGKMPAFPALADIDIAQIIVYVTNSFGNKQGMYTYGEVNNDLKQCLKLKE